MRNVAASTFSGATLAFVVAGLALNDIVPVKTLYYVSGVIAIVAGLVAAGLWFKDRQTAHG